MDRSRYVFDLLLADIGELNGKLVRHLLEYRTRYADAARFGQALEPRRNIHRVAKQVAIALHDVADGNADAKLHLAARRIGEVAGAQAFLDVDGAAHGFDGAGKLRHDGVARRVEDAAGGLGDEVVHDRPVGRQTPQRLLFIFGDEPAVSGDVGSR